MRNLIVAAALVLAGCYDSGGRRLDRGEDGTSFPDAVEDAMPDIHEETLEEVYDPSCLYGPDGMRQLADSGHTSNAPHLFWNGSEVGVVMFEGGGDMIGHSYVSLVNVAPDLSSSTEPRIVGEESHGWGEPAWTGSALGLCWHTDPGMVGRTAFRLLERNGDRIGGRVDLDMEGEACLGLVHGADRFLVSWRHKIYTEDDPFDVATWVQVLEADGTPVGVPLELVVGPYAGTTPSLAWTGDSFLVVYPEDGNLELLWIDTGGEIVGDGSFPAPGAAFCDVAENDGFIAAAWITGERYERGLHFRVFGPYLEPLGEELLLEEDGTGVASPDVVAAPDGWVVSWHVGSGEEAYAMMLHVDEAGVPRQPRILVYETQNSGYGGPTMLSVDDRLFVGISYYPDEHSWLEQVHLHGFSCAAGEMDVCARQDAEVGWGICDHPVLFGWKWTGESCQEVSGCDCLGEDCDLLARSRWDCLSDRVHCR